MPRPLKVYSLGNNGFINEATRRMLGMPDHHRQACVLVVATSKAEALRMLDSRRFGCRLSTSHLHEAEGNTVGAMRIAGVLSEPIVVAMPMKTGAGAGIPVVRIDEGGAPHPFGEVDSGWMVATFRKAGEVT